MKTVGEILSAARRKHGWSIQDLSLRTKIQERFLEALETSAFEKLPRTPFVKGFIRTASVELGLDPDQMVAVFRRDVEEDHRGQMMMRSLTQRSRPRLFWTPEHTAIAFAGVVIATFAMYLLVQLRFLSSPPRLELTLPKDREVVSETVLVEGKTDPSATVTVNDQEIRKNRDGVFSAEIELSEGTRTITVVVTGQNRKTTMIERTVIVKKDQSRFVEP